jgi:hypothetical protein
MKPMWAPGAVSPYRNFQGRPLHQQPRTQHGTSGQVPEVVYEITTDMVVEAFDQLCDAFLGLTLSGLFTDLAGLVASDRTPPNPWLPKEAWAAGSPCCVDYFRLRNLARVALDAAELGLSALGAPDVTGTVRCVYRVSEACLTLDAVSKTKAAFDDAQHLVPYINDIIAFKSGELTMQCGQMAVTLIPWGGFVAVAMKAVGRLVEARYFRGKALACAHYLHMRAYLKLACGLRRQPALEVVKGLLIEVPRRLGVPLETLLLEPKAYLVIADYLAVVP